MSVDTRHMTVVVYSTTGMLEVSLAKLGFSENESAIYLLLAEMGKSTAQLLAKRSGLARTTVYSVLDGLVAKGLVTEEKKQGTTFFLVSKPDAILRLVKKEEEALKARSKLAAEVVELLRPHFKSKLFSVPKIQFFEGKSAVENMLYDYTEPWRTSIGPSGVWWGYQDHTFVESYRSWLDFYWKTKQPHEKIQLISNAGAEVEVPLRGKISGRTVKAVAKEFDFSSSIWVCGEYIVMLMTRHDPHYAFQIKDPVFSANLRSIFELLWNAV